MLFLYCFHCVSLDAQPPLFRLESGTSCNSLFKHHFVTCLCFLIHRTQSWSCLRIKEKAVTKKDCILCSCFSLSLCFFFPLSSQSLLNRVHTWKGMETDNLYFFLPVSCEADSSLSSLPFSSFPSIAWQPIELVDEKDRIIEAASLSSSSLWRSFLLSNQWIEEVFYWRQLSYSFNSFSVKKFR